MADFTITSLRGGMNDSDPPIALPNDQCVLAENVAFNDSMLGERRRGSTAIDISGSDLVGNDRITFLHRHTPTSTNADSELWALGVTGTASSDLCRKTTTWATVSPVDAITLTGGYQYQLSAQSPHGKLFVTYKSGQDRLHVWDGTALRRTDLRNQPLPPELMMALGRQRHPLLPRPLHGPERRSHAPTFRTVRCADVRPIGLGHGR